MPAQKKHYIIKLNISNDTFFNWIESLTPNDTEGFTVIKLSDIFETHRQHFMCVVNNILLESVLKTKDIRWK